MKFSSPSPPKNSDKIQIVVWPKRNSNSMFLMKSYQWDQRRLQNLPFVISIRPLGENLMIRLESGPTIVSCPCFFKFLLVSKIDISIGSFLCDFSWVSISKYPFTPDKVPTTNQRNNLTRVYLGEPMSLSNLLIGSWVKGYLQEYE